MQDMVGAIRRDGNESESRTVTEEVYRRIERDIVSNRLLPDARLRSDDLRAAYGVGISPLREALTRLAGEHLVVQGNNGFRVAPLTPAIVADTTRARITIQCEALRRAIEFGNVDWEKEVVASAHALSRAIESYCSDAGSSDLNDRVRQFHRALFYACRSSWLRRTAELLDRHAERHRLYAESVTVRVEAIIGPVERYEHIARAAVS